MQSPGFQKESKKHWFRDEARFSECLFGNNIQHSFPKSSSMCSTTYLMGRDLTKKRLKEWTINWRHQRDKLWAVLFKGWILQEGSTVKKWTLTCSTTSLLPCWRRTPRWTSPCLPWTRRHWQLSIGTWICPRRNCRYIWTIPFTSKTLLQEINSKLLETRLKPSSLFKSNKPHM